MYAETLRSQTSNDAPHNGNNSNHNKSEKTNTITPEHRDTNMTNVHHKNDDDHAQKTDKTLAENSSNSSGTNSNRNSGTHNEQIESGDSPSNEVVVHNNVKPVVNNSVPVVSVSNANDVRQFDCGENNLFCFLTLNISRTKNPSLINGSIPFQIWHRWVLKLKTNRLYQLMTNKRFFHNRPMGFIWQWEKVRFIVNRFSSWDSQFVSFAFV